MKKVLLATTALTMSAGVAYAEVSLSGSARMGLQYTEATGDTTVDNRMTVTFSGSTETTSGLTLGATMNLRTNDGSDSAVSGARVSVAASGAEVAVGNIYGAIDSMPGLYISAGLTGLGWTGVAANTVAKGSFGWDSYTSSDNGVNGVEVIYSSGGFTGHLSYSDADIGSSSNNTAAYVSYAMGDWTAAVAMQDSTTNTQDKTIVTVSGNVGDFGVNFAAADNDGERKIVLGGSATFGATKVNAFVADEETGADTGFGLGLKHDLGGASLVGGVERTVAGVNRADLGVSFSF